jgi:hypothetical protein
VSTDGKSLLTCTCALKPRSDTKLTRLQSKKPSFISLTAWLGSTTFPVH